MKLKRFRGYRVESTWSGPGNTPPGCKPSPLPHQGWSPGVWGPGVLMNSQTGSIGDTQYSALFFKMEWIQWYAS